MSTSTVETFEWQPDARPPRKLPLIPGIFCAVAFAVYVSMYVRVGAWQMLVISASICAVAAILPLAFALLRRPKSLSTEFWLLSVSLAVCASGELVFRGVTPYNALCGITLIVLLCVSTRRSGKWVACIAFAALAALGIYLVNVFEPLPRFGIGESTLAYAYPLSLLCLIVPVPAWWTLRAFRHGTIRDRLLIASMLLVLLPTAMVGAVSILGSLAHGRQQLINQLESVATLKEAEIDTWLAQLKSDMSNVLADREVKSNLFQLLAETTDAVDRRVAYNKIQDQLVESLARTEQLEELFLIDINGRTVLSSNPMREGEYHSVQPYFRGGLKGFYVHPPVYSPALGLVSVVAASPIIDKHGQKIGVLVSRVNPDMLDQIMLERTGLGKTGETYLVDRHHSLLTGARLPEQEFASAYSVFSEGATSALDSFENGSGSYVNYRGEQVIGVYRWLPSLQLALLAEQQESEAFGPLYTTIRVSVGVGFAAALAAALLSLLVTQSIASRLGNLADTATQIAAGDSARTAEVGRADEIGTLAQAFNSMTAQLHELIGSLEERVQERTHALERRALQLETSARLGQEITSILDIDDLLTHVVELIREAFGYYQILIFLVDETTGRLVLQAGTGSVGQLLKHEGYSLEIGVGSLNGEAARDNKAIVSPDVSIEPRFHAMHQLPDVKSELVIPLRIGKRLIGTLDAQSNKLDDFEEEDVVVIQGLGDQISIAIENARLYQQSKELAVLEERTRLARELHDSVTQSLFSIDLHARAIATHLTRNPEKARAQIRQLRQITQESLQEMRSLILALRPASMTDPTLVEALGHLIERVRQPNGPEIRLHTQGNQKLPTDMEIGLFRITQEALRNALKHAKARNITITLMIAEDRVIVQVTDDGQGFDLGALPADPHAFGLVGMRERAELLGGYLKVASQRQAGTSIEVAVPSRLQERR